MLTEEQEASELGQLSAELMDSTEQLEQNIQKIYAKIPQTDDLGSLEQMAASLREISVRMTKAGTQIFAVSDELSARCRDTRQQRKKRKFIAAAPANGTIDLEERESNHFARGMGIYKLLLVCFIGSFAGVLVELLWCLIRNGYLESRSGLVYGPFNLLYGAGAVVLTVCLYRFRNRSGWISFLGGMLVGTVVEYLCSWGQEVLFGSRSWDYSALPFNLNGRVCLL
ncbi:MAG: putative ABC transporter permease, partial [Candidatus Faecousia sp.]|nr:putative ABC transporter permease [Candidatus Faecousia sp.]